MNPNQSTQIRYELEETFNTHIVHYKVQKEALYRLAKVGDLYIHKYTGNYWTIGIVSGKDSEGLILNRCRADGSPDTAHLTFEYLGQMCMDVFLENKYISSVIHQYHNYLNGKGI